MTNRILVVDDHAIVRHGLATLLAAESDLQVCAEAATITEALAQLESQKPDVLVADITLKDESGLDLVREARKRSATLRILVLSMHNEMEYAEQALRAGANGYVMKEQADELIVEAIRTVLAGRLFLSAAVAQKALQPDSSPGGTHATGGPDRLTEREREIFQLIGQGLTTRKIADQLSLSSRTVDVHRASIKRKLGVEDAAQLVREAVRWVDDGREIRN